MSLRTPEEQLTFAKEIRDKFPGKIPVLITSIPQDMIALEKEYFICNPNMNFLTLRRIIIKNITLGSTEGLYFSVGQSIIRITEDLRDMDKKYCNDGGFLKIMIRREAIFGGFVYEAHYFHETSFDKRNEIPYFTPIMDEKRELIYLEGGFYDRKPEGLFAKSKRFLKTLIRRFFDF